MRLYKYFGQILNFHKIKTEQTYNFKGCAKKDKSYRLSEYAIPVPKWLPGHGYFLINKKEQKNLGKKITTFFLILNYFYVNTVALMRLLIKYLLLATGAWFTRHEKWRRIAAATGAQCVDLFSDGEFLFTRKYGRLGWSIFSAFGYARYVETFPIIKTTNIQYKVFSSGHGCLI